MSYDTSSEPAFFDLLGAYGDSSRCKGEMIDSSVTAAGDELAEAGVIFIAAAGNSNQTQVAPGDLDFNNYWSTSSQGDSVSLQSATHFEFGLQCYNTVNRSGWPQALGRKHFLPPAHEVRSRSPSTPRKCLRHNKNFEADSWPTGCQPEDHLRH